MASLMVTLVKYEMSSMKSGKLVTKNFWNFFNQIPFLTFHTLLFAYTWIGKIQGSFAKSEGHHHFCLFNIASCLALDLHRLTDLLTSLDQLHEASFHKPNFAGLGSSTSLLCIIASVTSPNPGAQPSLMKNFTHLQN